MQLEVDHIIPYKSLEQLCKDPDRLTDVHNDCSNLTFLCKRCNASKGEEILFDWLIYAAHNKSTTMTRKVSDRWLNVIDQPNSFFAYVNLVMTYLCEISIYHRRTVLINANEWMTPLSMALQATTMYQQLAQGRLQGGTADAAQNMRMSAALSLEIHAGKAMDNASKRLQSLMTFKNRYAMQQERGLKKFHEDTARLRTYIERLEAQMNDPKEFPYVTMYRNYIEKYGLGQCVDWCALTIENLLPDGAFEYD